MTRALQLLLLLLLCFSFAVPSNANDDYPWFETWDKVKTQCGFDHGGKHRTKYQQQLKILLHNLDRVPEKILKRENPKEYEIVLGELLNAIYSDNVDLVSRHFQKHGFVKAAGYLSQAYLYGLGVHENPKKAIQYAQYGAKYNDTASINTLAVNFSFNKTRQDEASFWACYGALPVGGLPKKTVYDRYMHYNFFLMAEGFYVGARGMTKNRKFGAEMLVKTDEIKVLSRLLGEQTIAEVNRNTHSLLAYAYSHGDGIKQDFKQARGHALNAYHHGDEKGLRILAWLYANVAGIKKSPDLAYAIVLIGQKYNIDFSEGDIKKLTSTLSPNVIKSINQHSDDCYRKYYEDKAKQLVCAEKFKQ